MLTAILIVAVVMGTGCGSAGKEKEISEEPVTEAVTDDDITEVLENSSISEEENLQEEGGENEEGTEEEDLEADASENPLDIYSSILDRFYYQITGGWDENEDISYLFSWSYTYINALSDAGYMLTDLNGDEMPELLISSVKDGEDGLIYDLYTCVNGEIIHTASSGERYRYNYCEDGTIYYEGSSGASNSTFASYTINTEDGLLKLKEVVRYDSDEDKANPWFYGTEECYDGKNGFDYSLMSCISEEEAQDIIGSYRVSDLELTLFDSYVPKGDIPTDMLLKTAYQSAIGSETNLLFECDDYDEDGIKEAFGITGTDDGVDIHDLKLYYVDQKGEVSCIADLDILFGFGGMPPAGIMDTGSAKFLVFGGACGQETWLYGIRDGEVYQPEVSGKHSDFLYMDGKYIAMPHEGGEGFYQIVYDFDPATGEFVEQKSE